jgi:hypothetical protein
MTAPISARPSERHWHFDSTERGSCDPALPRADARGAIRAGVHPDAVAATEATKIQSRQRGGILISPVGFAETVLHSPSGLASVPGSISAGPIVLAAAPVSRLIVATIVRARRRRAIARTRRRSVARTRRRSVAVARGWSIARTWLNIDILGECRAGCAGENHSYEPRYQHLLHDSSL